VAGDKGFGKRVDVTRERLEVEMKRYIIAAFCVLFLTFCSCTRSKQPQLVPAPEPVADEEMGKDGKTAIELTKEGDQLIQEGSLDPAISRYKEAIAKDKDYAPAHLQLARAYGRMRNMELYERELHETIKIDTENTEARYLLASWYFAKGDTDSALEEMDELKAIDPENPKYSLFLVMLYDNKKEYEKAIEELNVLLEKDPENMRYLLSLGNMYKMLDEKDKAHAYYHQVIDLAPKSFEAMMAKEAIEEKKEPTPVPALAPQK